jgi:hypothetical protein
LLSHKANICRKISWAEHQAMLLPVHCKAALQLRLDHPPEQS